MRQRPKESEIKLALTEEEIARLRPRLGEPASRLRQVNYFYETPGDDLAGVRASLRVREERHVDGTAEKLTLTVKEAGVRAGALMVRPEMEAEIEPPVWDAIRSGERHFADINLAPIGRLKELLANFARLEIVLLGKFETERDVFRFKPDVRTTSGTNLWAGDAPLEVLLDRVSYPDGSVEWELESELPQAEAGKAVRILRVLFSQVDIDWRPSAHGKYVRLRKKIGRLPSGLV